MEFNETIKTRRSCYNLGPLSAEKQKLVPQILEHCILNAPTPFNSQSARIILLENKNHKKLWNIVLNTLQKKVPPENFAPVKEKIATFAAASGTILYFEDTIVTENLQKQYPAYAVNFPIWAAQSNGMLQFSVWCSLAGVNIGASLQHYNPIIDAEVRTTFKIPATWRLIAQMPFGEILSAPRDKTFEPLEKRLKILS